MKKKIFYLFAHQDDEFGVFIKLKEDIKKYDTYIFYLTKGTNKKLNKLKPTNRDKESLKTLVKIGLSKKNIFFLGREFQIDHNKLYLNLNFIFKKLMQKINIIGKPNMIISHSWEGGHEDHDACNLIARKFAHKFKILDKSFEFSLYNSYKSSFFYYRVFNPIKKGGKKYKTNLRTRLFLIFLLFNYKSQIKTWIGLYPFIIYHYLFKGYNFIENLNSSLFIKRPHKNVLLYEKRKSCTFKKFNHKSKTFLDDIR